MPRPRDILKFPPATTFTPEQALVSAGQARLEQVVVVGITEEGDLVTRSSRMTRAEALWLLETAKRWTLGVT